MSSPIKHPEDSDATGITVRGTITGRIEKSGPLVETNQMLEDVAQAIPESILLLSTDLKILWANRATVNQAGLGEHELVGRYCYQAACGDNTHCQPPDRSCPVHELIRTGEPATTVHEHHDENGNTTYAEVGIYPIKDNAGTIVRFVHISKDITERVHFEQERETLILELQDALFQIKTLTGIIPICSSCKKIRNHSGSWEQIESYIHQHSEAEFSHGMCPHCAKKLYPGHS